MTVAGKFRAAMVLVAVAMCATACADSSAKVEAGPPPDAAQNPCPTWTQADLTAAKTALREVTYTGGDIEPLALLVGGVNTKGEWDGIVYRAKDRSVIAIDNGYDLSENQVRLLLQPGDLFTADLKYDDTMIEKVHVVRKQAFTVTPTTCKGAK